MGRYSQTLARLGAGYSVVAALAWLLWPSNFSFLANPEALFVFCTAFVVWHFTEFKLSEELSSGGTSENDVRLARELISLHVGDLQYLLKDTDLWSFVPSDRYSQLGSICDRWDRGALFFHNKRLNRKLADLVQRLSSLHLKIAQDTVPVMLGGEFHTGYKPPTVVSDEEYERRRKESGTANALASQAWDLLDDIVQDVKDGIPSALDKPLE